VDYIARFYHGLGHSFLLTAVFAISSIFGIYQAFVLFSEKEARSRGRYAALAVAAAASIIALCFIVGSPEFNAPR